MLILGPGNADMWLTGPPIGANKIYLGLVLMEFQPRVLGSAVSVLPLGSRSFPFRHRKKKEHTATKTGETRHQGQHPSTPELLLDLDLQPESLALAVVPKGLGQCTSPICSTIARQMDLANVFGSWVPVPSPTHPNRQLSVSIVGGSPKMRGCPFGAPVKPQKKCALLNKDTPN